MTFDEAYNFDLLNSPMDSSDLRQIKTLLCKEAKDFLDSLPPVKKDSLIEMSKTIIDTFGNKLPPDFKVALIAKEIIRESKRCDTIKLSNFLIGQDFDLE
jgi:hypothetical protein